jgi:hypothetical protein
MSTLSLDQLQQDHLAMAVARALAMANDAALAHGTHPDKSLITISEEPAEQGRLWRVHYGPRDYVNQRGGDLIVLIDEQSDVPRRVIRGQ